ncbi:MAG: 23S rRNA (uracil(1939)-C(5))-methyltransferase RlmD [Candidatus Omnitrophica bacterium]|nr:23S rRNA (uracil(1939)-C(5))-methyltransferase RlmD [Candidatus Omnitrophota bacterium]
MELTIEKIVYPGKSLARKDGQVFFLDEGLPGEIVQVMNVQKKNNFSQATVFKIIQPSHNRILPKCEHYKICSPLQYIDYKEQLIIKTEQLADIFKSFTTNPIAIEASPDSFGYRNKISLNLLWKSKRAFLAYNIRDTHNKFIDINNCFLVSDNLNAILKNTVQLINKHKHKEITGVILRENSCGKAHLTIDLSSEKSLDKIKRTFTENTIPNLLGVVALLKKNDFIQSINIHGANFITENILSNIFSIGPLSFFQINTAMIELVCKDITKNVSFKNSDTIFDLYCGVGTFGLIFSKQVKEVIGIESETANTSFFIKNCKDNDIKNAKVVTSKSEDVCKQLKDMPSNIIIMDPPRSGVHKNILKTLLDARHMTHDTQLIYLSCDPVTMARDLEILTQKYKIHFLKAYDFFPQTPHIETLCILTRK